MNSVELIRAILLKSRTIVSSGFDESLALLSCELPLTLCRFPSGGEYSTWVVPPRWEVIKAELSNGERVLASYADHPLFLAPYSCSFHGWVTRDELLQHIRYDINNPNDFVYEYRLASDYRRRLNEWIITLPYSIVEKLDRPKYFINIQVVTSPGEMLVGENTIHGRSPNTVFFLSHLCHSGQANDGLAGVVAGIELMKRIQEVFPSPQYSYRLLIMPETIGSVAYVTEHIAEAGLWLGAMFLEMPAIREKLRLKYSRRKYTYLDRVAEHVLRSRNVEYDTSEFHESYGNDEKIFDYPGVGVPAISLQRYPLRTYHSSADNLEGIEIDSMNEFVSLACGIVTVIEKDYRIRFGHTAPVHLTRFGLYSDAVHNSGGFLLYSRCIDMAWQGWSVFDISLKLGVPVGTVVEYFDKFADSGLIEKVPLDPDYFRRIDDR